MQADSVATPSEFDAWARPHLLTMHRFAMRLVGATDAEDLAQVALTQAWRKRETFDPTRGSAQAWLLAIVAGQARRHRRFTEGAPADHLDVATTDQALDVDLERAIAALAERQRLAVTLFYTLDLPLNDVAAVMACAPGTVKATLNQARSRLRELLGDDHG